MHDTVWLSVSLFRLFVCSGELSKMSKVLLQEKNERLLSNVENRLNRVLSPSSLLSSKIYIEKDLNRIKNLAIKSFVISSSHYI